MFSSATEIAQFKPTDATSNPSLVLAAVSQPEYAHHIDRAVAYATKQLRSSSLEEQAILALDHVVRAY